MANKTATLLPTTNELLIQLGERLRVARLRRRLTAKQVAQRAGMAPMTLRSLEQGSSGVTMGAYLAVMQVLGLEKDIDLLGQADPVGRARQDARLPARRVAPFRGSAEIQRAGTESLSLANTYKFQDERPYLPEQADFVTADALLALIERPAATNKPMQ